MSATLKTCISRPSTAQGETPATVLPGLIRKYPDVIVVRDMADADTGRILCGQAVDERLVITSTRTKDAVEVPLRLLKLGIEPAELAPALTAVLNQHLIRKLCDTCREAFPPPPETLKQLGLPADRVEWFYRPPTPPEDGSAVKTCQDCQGVGYLGRTSIFELLVIDDRMRKVIETAPKLELMRDAARRAKHRSLQDEGALLVARGVTSLQELIRVLKG